MVSLVWILKIERVRAAGVLLLLQVMAQNASLALDDERHAVEHAVLR